MGITVISILNWIHKKGGYRILCAISSLAYFIKGHGFVRSSFHFEFRAYEYKVKDDTYLCIGHGWAYTHNYLKNLLIDTFCYFYAPKQGECVIDIGAGLGEETVIFDHLVGDTGKVISIEANPNTFKGLKYLCECNNFKQVLPLNLAIYSNNGEVTIEDDQENYLKNSISDISSGIKVQAKTLDTVVNENQVARIDYLKVNIEGAEQFLI